MALACAPLLAEYQKLYLHTARELRVASDDEIGTRPDLIWSEMMDAEAAQWPRHSDFGILMINAEDGKAA